MRFNIEKAVEIFAKEGIVFLHPLYEAIANSLEAEATEITIDFDTEKTISEEFIPKVIGFSITDNGNGFTEKNRSSFLELWTDNKKHLGCKGSGRFTWLNVYENINIESQVYTEQKQIKIHFHKKFDDNIDVNPWKVEKNITTIKFKDVTDKYYSESKNIDNRVLADIDKITEAIKQNLLIKLFLLKNEGKKFYIKIRLNNQERAISEETIPDLEHISFTVVSEIDSKEYSFDMYYNFKDDRKNIKKMYYCASGRAVKEISGVDLTFELPTKCSFDMLLCSDYLNEMVNESRDDFPSMVNTTPANVVVPLKYKDIIPKIIQSLHQILLIKFPDLEKYSKEEEQKAINDSPYLAKYIKDNDDIVKTQTSLTKKATKAFNEHKIKAKEKFEKILGDASISQDGFNQAVAELSEVAAAELGEYILYRDNIIKALQESVQDKEKMEKFLHDIFMPQRTMVNKEETKDYTMTNMWLLDDKFMTFSNAFSDISIKTIIETIFKDKTIVEDDLGMDSKKPDMFVFYNKEISRDALVVEFKGSNVPLGEKEKAIAEISRNSYLLKEKIKEINTIWAYIITSIDDEFEVSLRANGYKPRFTNAKDGKILYFYNEGVAHIYAIDVKALTADAFARNKTFLDILKNQH